MPLRLFVIPLALLSAWALVARLRMSDNAYIEITPFVVVWAIAAALFVGIGSLFVSGERTLRVALLAMAATGSTLFAALAIFSIGIFVLPFGLAFLAWLFVLLRRSASARANAAAVGGALMAFGAIGMLLVGLQPALASCGERRVSTSSGGFFGPQARTSGGGVSADGVASGFIDYGDRRAVFRCIDGKLVDFHYE